MKEGDVILTPIQQANGVFKNRPAIILRQMPPFDDLLACGISTQLHRRVVDFDEIISPADSDFATSGLKSESLVRLGFLAVLPSKNIIGSISTISTERHEHLLKKLAEYLVKRDTQ